METRAQFGAVPRAVIVLATLALLTALAAGAIAVGSSVGPKLPAPFGPAGNGLIAFVSNGDLYTVEPDGTDLKRITSGPEVDGSPSWSRDGTKLAFLREPADGGEAALMVTDAEGHEPVTIPIPPDAEFWLIEWSEDGTEIMLNATVPGLGSDPCSTFPDNGGRCGSRLFVVASDGSGTPIQVGDMELDARGAVLSPDGTTVAFGGGEAGSEAIYLMQWDGTNVRRLEGITPDTKGYAFMKLSWSADGERIVTMDDLGAGNQKIWVVEVDGSGTTQLSDDTVNAIWPDYSPDGSGIMWDTNGVTTIFTPGDDPTSNMLFGIGEATWSPDSAQLVGVRGTNLVVFDRFGENITEIGVADEDSPSWQRIGIE